MELIFTPDDSGKTRASGYATVDYSSSAENETVVETSEDGLASIFKTAKANGETLEGGDAPIEAAIDDPLSFIDYLVFDGEAISFDSEYARDPNPED